MNLEKNRAELSRRTLSAFVAGLLALLSLPSYGLESGTWSLSTDGETFSLHTQDVPIKEVISSINEVTPIQIDVNTLPDKLLSVKYTNVSLEELLSRLPINFALSYRLDETGSDYELSSGWISRSDAPPPKPGAQAAPSSTSATAKTLIEKLKPFVTEEALKQDQGVLYRSGMGLSMNVDGQLSEWPKEIAWHKVERAPDPTQPTDQVDAAYEFATVADQTNLYMAIKIQDDARTLKPDPKAPEKEQDYLELKIGGELSVINRHHVWRRDKNGQVTNSGRQYVRLGNGTSAYIVDRDDGWHLEAVISFESLGIDPKDGGNIPFDITLNDADEGKDTKAPLVWSNSSTLEGATPAGDSSSSSLTFIDLSP